MVLTGGAIAGIIVACAIACFILIAVVYYVIKKHRENGNYEERCSRLWQKYGRKGSGTMASFPYADPSYVTTTVPGQNFTPSELNQGFMIPGRIQNDAGRVNCCYSLNSNFDSIFLNCELLLSGTMLKCM